MSKSTLGAVTRAIHIAQRTYHAASIFSLETAAAGVLRSRAKPSHSRFSQTPSFKSAHTTGATASASSTWKSSMGNALASPHQPRWMTTSSSAGGKQHSSNAPTTENQSQYNFEDVVEIYQPQIIEDWKDLPRIVVDVRTSEEVREGMIPQARHIPIADLLKMSEEDVREQFDGHLTMLYCKSGVRSQLGTTFLHMKQLPAINLGGYHTYAEAKGLVKPEETEVESMS